MIEIKDCPKCGAPLDPDGYCSYHMPIRPVVVNTLQDRPEPKDKSHESAWYIVCAIAFTLAVTYTFLGNTLELFPINPGLYALAYVVKVPSTLYLTLRYIRKKVSFLAAMFGINLVLASIILVGLLIDLILG